MIEDDVRAPGVRCPQCHGSDTALLPTFDDDCESVYLCSPCAFAFYASEAAPARTDGCYLALLALCLIVALGLLLA